MMHPSMTIKADKNIMDDIEAPKKNKPEGSEYNKLEQRLPPTKEINNISSLKDQPVQINEVIKVHRDSKLNSMLSSLH